MKKLKDWGVEGWEKTDVSTKRDDARIYYKKHEKGNGFDFKVIEFSGGDEDPNNEFDLFMHGIAYFDGLRHVYFGEDEDKPDGYLYYPDPNLLALVFQVLAVIEKQYCREEDL